MVARVSGADSSTGLPTNSRMKWKWLLGSTTSFFKWMRLVAEPQAGEHYMFQGIKS
jgi:hypothetical protein